MLGPGKKDSDVANSTLPQHGRDTGLESPVLDEIDFFAGGRMSGTGPTSPYIKDEPDWADFSSSMPNRHHLNMQMRNQQYPQVASGSIDPNDLSAHHHQDTLTSFNFNAPIQNNMTGSFNLGNSGIGDDELADLEINDTRRQSNQPHGIDQMNDFSFDQPQHGQGAMPNMFSHTPNGEPMQSPFLQNFNIYQQMASPRQRPISQGGNMAAEYGMPGTRRSLPHAMERKVSEARSPMTPKTPALGGLNLSGTPESTSLGSQPMSALSHRHQKSLSGQWDNSSASLNSYIDSPMASPSNMGSHAGITEMLRSTKGAASVPSKLEHPTPAYQTQEAKRRRRRESHNLVERRRRDNINERIQELSHLVPQHRLEDEKVRKYLANNGPLSPSMNPTGVSPPQATSMLANGGRRAATGPGGIAMGLAAVDDKEKGPNKGDILNGSVSWTRDLMWALHKKMEQEAQLKETVESLGGTWPFSETDEDRRLKSELADAMDKNDASTFSYSRAHGSGLRVPSHTDHAGNPVSQNQLENMSPNSPLPGNSSSGNSDGPQFWGSSVQPPLKEEDEFDIHME